jgi:hypothetical protein
MTDKIFEKREINIPKAVIDKPRTSKELILIKVIEK